ncbi:MAG: hypothetical protein MSA56_00360 [Clostridium sp.]|nr:hypothetical protein [Clostridium sp.]
MKKSYGRSREQINMIKGRTRNALNPKWRNRPTTEEENDFLIKYGLEEYIKTVEKGNKKTLDTTIRKYYV